MNAYVERTNVIDYMDTLDIDELYIIAKLWKIKEDNKYNIINKLIKAGFNYISFIKNILSQGSESKLQKLCKLHNISDNGSKNDLIDRLLDNKISMEKIVQVWVELVDGQDIQKKLNMDDPCSIVKWIISILKDNSSITVPKPKKENLDILDDGLDDDDSILIIQDLVNKN